MSIIEYQSGIPIETGVYACRVPAEGLPGWHEDKFLLFYDSKWSYLGSDIHFRDKVYGWIGPLRRTRDTTAHDSERGMG